MSTVHVGTEQADILQQLEASRDEFSAAALRFSEEQARKRPAPDRWSVLEIVEHVVIVEKRFLGWLKNPVAGDPAPANKEKEAEFQRRMGDRSVTRMAPEPVHPKQTFSSLTEALEDFHATRERTLQFARQHGADLYKLKAEHSFFGVMNGVEVLVLISGHALRHVAQIREIPTP